MAHGGKRENAGRKSAWKNSDTRTIRIPTVFAEQLLEIARRLDAGDKVEIVSKSNSSVTKSKRDRKSKGESVTKPKLAVVDCVTDSEGRLQPLSCKALARRLGVSDTAIMKHRDGKVALGIPEWTRGRDPDDVAWEYRKETKLFHPLPKLPT